MMAVATQPRTELRCARCRTRLAPGQDWCLGCGAAANTRVLAPPSWKLATATILGVLAAVAVGVVLLVTSLSSDSDRAASRRVASVPAAPPAGTSTPPPAATPAVPPASGTQKTTTTPASKKPAAPITGGGVSSWPSGKQGWTVVLGTEVEPAAARSRAQGYIAKGVKSGVLDATRYSFSTPTGAFVIFFGEFDTQSAAVTSESALADKLPATAYVTSVTPR